MYHQRLDLLLERASADPLVSSPEFQTELKKLTLAMWSAGVVFGTQSRRDPGAVGKIQLPEFELSLGSIKSPLIGLLGTWLRTRPGRKLVLKLGDVAAEARTADELVLFSRLAAAFLDEPAAGGPDGLAHAEAVDHAVLRLTDEVDELRRRIDALTGALETAYWKLSGGRSSAEPGRCPRNAGENGPTDILFPWKMYFAASNRGRNAVEME